MKRHFQQVWYNGTPPCVHHVNTATLFCGLLMTNLTRLHSFLTILENPAPLATRNFHKFKLEF